MAKNIQEEQCADIFVMMMTVYEAFLTVQIKDNIPEEKTEEMTMSMITHMYKEKPELKEYAEANIPLAMGKGNSAESWVYGNLQLYKPVIIEQINKGLENG